MPPRDAYDSGFKDGLQKAELGPSRAGYPVEYEQGYAEALLTNSKLRTYVKRVGAYLIKWAERPPHNKYVTR